MLTLADAKLNTQDDVDLTVIDEFRKSSFLLNALPFHDTVNPSGGGATLTYGYTRVIAERPASTRKLNTDYERHEAKRKRYTTDLIPMGGAFGVDRAIAKLGPAASNEVSFQMRELIKSTVARFHDEFINGTEASFESDDPGFDGIDAAVTGTVTESAVFDGTTVTSKETAIKAKAALNAWLRSFDGAPTVIIGNEDGIAWLEQLADWIGFYTETADEFGRTIQSYRGTPFVDLKEKAGSNDPIVSTTAGVTSLYAVRFGQDAVHGLTTVGSNLVNAWLPNFDLPGAVQPGEVELGPVGLAVKKTRAAGAFRLRVEKAGA